MTISVTDLKTRLLEVIRNIEREQTSVDVERHGRVVARLVPVSSPESRSRAWTRLRGSGELLSDPEESVLEDRDFESLQ